MIAFFFTIPMSSIIPMSAINEKSMLKISRASNVSPNTDSPYTRNNSAEWLGVALIIANLVASSLFGDGAAAVVGKGGDHSCAGPRGLATRSRIYPDTEEVMGWDIGSNGFKIKLSTECTVLARLVTAKW